MMVMETISDELSFKLRTSPAESVLKTIDYALSEAYKVAFRTFDDGTCLECLQAGFQHSLCLVSSFLIISVIPRAQTSFLISLLVNRPTGAGPTGHIVCASHHHIVGNDVFAVDRKSIP